MLFPFKGGKISNEKRVDFALLMCSVTFILFYRKREFTAIEPKFKTPYFVIERIALAIEPLFEHVCTVAEARQILRVAKARPPIFHRRECPNKGK